MKRRTNMDTRTITKRRTITGSIGIAWPPKIDRMPVKDNVTGGIHPFGNDRLKGFVPFVLDLENTENTLREIREIRTRENVSRVTIRALVSDNDLYQITQQILSEHGFSTEAYIPLGKVLPGFTLVYFGHNTIDRTVSNSVRVNQINAIKAILGRPQKNEEELLGTMQSNGYVFDKNVDTSNGDIDRMIALYQICMPRYLMELNRENMSLMIENRENDILVVRHNGKIIASAFAEHAMANVKNSSEMHILHLVEMSECVTDPEYRGNGLMSAILYGLYSQLEPGTIVYSEARASSIGMNTALRNNGFDGRPNNVLPKHCIIGDIEPAEGPGPFEHMENLQVWYKII